jgi:cell division GTPase FtsZ
VLEALQGRRHGVRHLRHGAVAPAPGAAPIIAELAREVSALTVGIVTRPFQFEGKKRTLQAEMGIAEMRKNVDTMIVVPNERLLAIVGKGTQFLEALKKADEVLLHATQGISRLITTTGIINVDFADVRTVMQNGGAALMGTGIGRGENRALEAAQQAISSPLLDNVSITGASAVLLNIVGGDDLTLGRGDDDLRDRARGRGEDAEIIFGAGNDPAMQGEIRVTVIATGFDRGQCTSRGPTQRRHLLPGPQARAAGRESAARRAPAATAAQVRPLRQQPRPGPTYPTWKSRRSYVARWIDAARYLAAAVVTLAFALGGRQFWFRNHPRSSAAAGVPAPDSAPGHRVPDTLRRGETLAHLFARNGLTGAEVRHLASLLDLRKLRTGLVFHVRRQHADSAPDQISVRTGPEQRLRMTRLSRPVARDGRADPLVHRYGALCRGDRIVALRGARPGDPVVLAGGRRTDEAGMGNGGRVRVAARLQPRPAAGRQVPGGAGADDIGGG